MITMSLAFTYIASGIAVRAQSYRGPVHESENAVIWTRDSDKEVSVATHFLDCQIADVLPI